MTKEAILQGLWPAGFSKTKVRLIKKDTAKNSRRARLAFALVAANIVLLFAYVYGVNQFTSQGYEIKTLQNQLANLTSDNKQINLKVSEAASMVSIQNDFLSANYVPAETPKFLQANDNELTMK